MEDISKIREKEQSLYVSYEDTIIEFRNKYSEVQCDEEELTNTYFDMKNYINLINKDLYYIYNQYISIDHSDDAGRVMRNIKTLNDRAFSVLNKMHNDIYSA